MKRRSMIAGPLLMLPISARADTVRLSLGQASVTLEIEGDAPPSTGSLIRRWIDRSADAVIAYYGRFPVPEAYLHIIVTGGRGVRGGQSFPGAKPLVRIRVGAASTEDDLLHKDWVMVHEMVHLAFPWMNRRHNWMAEGLAVYVESIARVQAGHLRPAQIWYDFVTMMPRGLPKPGEGGYDVTPTWGRTYWGGAIYCLLADIAIRKATANASGLQQALRAINAQRDFRHEWDFRETLALGDAATGTRVLTEQYDAMRIEPVSPDLESLWAALGVTLDGKTVVFDDAAPLAAIRLAIEAKA